MSIRHTHHGGKADSNFGKPGNSGRRYRIAVFSSDQLEVAKIAESISKSPILDIVVVSVNPAEFLRAIEEKRVDVVIVGFLPERAESDRGLNVIRAITNRVTVVITEQCRNLDLPWLASKGVRGIIADKTTNNINLAVQVAYLGGAFVGKEVLRSLLSDSPVHESQTSLSLTLIEKQLITHLCEGLSSTAIGRLLHKSPRTIEGYRARLYRKLGVSTKEQLIIKVFNDDSSLFGALCRKYPKIP